VLLLLRLKKMPNKTLFRAGDWVPNLTGKGGWYDSLTNGSYTVYITAITSIVKHQEIYSSLHFAITDYFDTLDDHILTLLHPLPLVCTLGP
jgi:hypothetical protein